MKNITYDRRRASRLLPLLGAIGREIHERAAALEALEIELEQLTDPRVESVSQSEAEANTEAGTETNTVESNTVETNTVETNTVELSNPSAGQPEGPEGDDEPNAWSNRWPNDDRVYSLQAEIAAHRRGLRSAREELQRLGCSVLGTEPLTFRIPGRVGEARHSFVWQTGDPVLE